MKKILVLALTLILSVTLIGVLNLKETGYIFDEGYITTTSNDVLNLVLRNDVDPNNASDSKEKLTFIEEMTLIYETINGVYVSTDKIGLNDTFPMYLSDGNVLRFFNSDSILIEKEFDSVTTYDGLYLSKGSSFNSDGELADYTEFILSLLPSGLFMNASIMKVINGFDERVIKMNSILYLDKGRINYLEFNKGELIYSTIDVFDDTKVIIGSHEYDYLSLYNNLYDLRESLNIPDPVIPTNKKKEPLDVFDSDDKKEEHSLVKKEEKDVVDLEDTLIQEQDESTREDEGEITKGNDTNTSGGNPGIAESSAPAIPFVIFDEKDLISSVYQAKTKAIINDKNGLISGGVKFYIYNDRQMKSLQMRKSLKETGEISFEVLEPDKDYYLYISYNYKSRGNLEEVIVTKKPVKFHTLPREGHLAKVAFSYDIDQPSESTNGLPIYYHNKIKVDNLKFDNLAGARIINEDEVTSGSYNRNNTSLNLRPRVRVADYDPKNVPEEVVINFISKIELEVRKASSSNESLVKFKLSSNELSELKKGNNISFTSGKDLTYSTDYTYKFVMYDKFNHPLENVYSNVIGNTHTCKTPPSVNMNLTSYKLKNVSIDLNLTNFSKVNLEDVYFYITKVNMSDKVALEGSISTSGITKPLELDSENKVSLNGLFSEENPTVKLNFTNLEFGEVYTIKVLAKYDLNNGLNLADYKELLKEDFYTSSIEEAGKAIYNYHIYEVSSNSVKYAIDYSYETSIDITNILDEIKFSLARIDNNNVLITDTNLPTFTFDKTTYQAKDLTTATSVGGGYKKIKLVSEVVFDTTNNELVKEGFIVNLYYDASIESYATNVYDLFKFSRNEDIYLSIEYINKLASKTNYKVNLDSLIKLNEEDSGTSVTDKPKQKENEFTTLKMAPKVNLSVSRSFVSSNFVEFYFTLTKPDGNKTKLDLVEDKDGAILNGDNKGVMIRLYECNNLKDENGEVIDVVKNLVYNDYINTNEFIDTYRIEGLDPSNDFYEIEVVALYYNEGYKDSEKELNRVLMTEEFSFKNTVSAKLELNSVQKRFSSKTLDERNILNEPRHKVIFTHDNTTVDNQDALGIHEGYYHNSVGTLYDSSSYSETNYIICEIEPNTIYAVLDNADSHGGSGYMYEYNGDFGASWPNYKSEAVIAYKKDTNPNRIHSNFTFKTRPNVNRLMINVTNRSTNTIKLIKLDDSYENLDNCIQDITDSIKIKDQDKYIHYRFSLSDKEGYFVSDYIKVDEESLYRLRTPETRTSHSILMFNANFEETTSTGSNFESVSQKDLSNMGDDLPTLFYVPRGVNYIKIDMAIDDLTPDNIESQKVLLQKYESSDLESEAKLVLDFKYLAKNKKFDEFTKTYDSDLILKETAITSSGESFVKEHKITLTKDASGNINDIEKYIYRTEVNKAIKYTYDLELGLKDKGEVVRKISLTSLNFNGNEVITSINNQYDIPKMLLSPKSKYILNNDIVIDKNGCDLKSPLHVNDYWYHTDFNGHFDGNGYSIVKKTDDFLFGSLGENAIIENLSYEMQGLISNGRSGFIEYNQGIVRNVRAILNVNYKGLNGISSNYGLISYNYQNGTLENFVVKVENFETYRYGAAVVGENRGLIRNGYVYGEPIRARAYEKKDGKITNIRKNVGVDYREYVGIVVQNNIPSGIVDSVYTTNDLIIDDALEYKGVNAMTTLVSRGNGTVKNCYSLGSVIIRSVSYGNNGAEDIFVTNYAGKAYEPLTREDNYENLAYYTKDPYPYGDDGTGESSIEKPYYKLKDIKLIRSSQVYDYNWHETYLSDAFEIRNNVSRKMLPRLKMGDKMKKYEVLDNVSIKDVIDAEVVDKSIRFKSSSVIEESKDYAIIKLALENKVNASIEEIKFQNLATVKKEDILKQEYIFDNYFVTFKVSVDDKVENPVYRSKYKLQSLVAKLPRGEVQPYSFVGELNYIYPSFYKPIETVEDYLNIFNPEANPDTAGTDRILGNYRLVADLDFANQRVGDYSTTLGGTLNFGGKLDGTKFELQEDGTYKKTGFYRFKNMVTRINGNPNFILECYDATFSNLIFDNFDNTNSYNEIYYTGVIRYANSSTFDNVHVINSKIKGGREVGGLLGEGIRVNMRNCSVNNSYVKGVYDGQALGSYIGGIVGYGSVLDMHNCYSSNTEVVAESPNSVLGTGGLMGGINSGRIFDSYSNNYVSSTGINTGGIVGYSNYSTIERCYSTSKVYSGSHVVSGLVGYLYNSSNVYNNLVLGSVNSKLSSCVDINTITGGKTGYHVKEEHYIDQGNFAYTGFQINDKKISSDDFFGPGKNYKNIPYDEFVTRLGVNKLLSQNELNKEETYKDIIRLGDAYSYKGGEKIYGSNDIAPSIDDYLPMLYDTYGNILYGQQKIKLQDEEPTLYNVEIGGDITDYNTFYKQVETLVVTVKLPFKYQGLSNDKFNSLEIQGTNIVSQDKRKDSVVGPENIEFEVNGDLLYIKVTGLILTNYFDSYLLRFSTDLGNDNNVRTSMFIKLPNIVNFFEINSVDEYNLFFKENALGYNNISFNVPKVDGEYVLDFGTSDNNIYNVRVNNVEFSGDSKLIIKNANLVATDSSFGIFSEITGNISNICFKDINLSVPDNKTKENLGVIAKHHGNMNNVSFENIHLDVKNNTSNNSVRTTRLRHVGSVGYATGNMTNITLSNVHILGSTAERVGLLVGENGPRMDFRNINIHGYDNPLKPGETLNNTMSFTNDTYYVGGVCGISYGPYLGLALDGSTISDIEIDGARHVGGVFGYTYPTGVLGEVKVKNIYITNNNTKKTDSYGGFSGTAYGQVFPRPEVPLELENINIKVENGRYVGGILGLNGTELRNAIIRNSHIAGNENVAGINNHHTYDCMADNVTVVGIGDEPKNIGGIIGTITNPHPMRNVITNSYIGIPKPGDTNEYTKDAKLARAVGGVIGYTPYNEAGNIASNNITNCYIEGNENVGGVIGEGAGTIYENNLWTTTIKGKKNVGGVSGYTVGAILDNNNLASDTTIIGEENAGGISGFINKNEYASNQGYRKTVVYKNIVAAKVEGVNNTAGFVGLVNGNISEDENKKDEPNIKSNIFLGEVGVSNKYALGIIKDGQVFNNLPYTRYHMYAKYGTQLVNDVAGINELTSNSTASGTYKVSAKDLATRKTYEDIDITDRDRFIPSAVTVERDLAFSPTTDTTINLTSSDIKLYTTIDKTYKLTCPVDVYWYRSSDNIYNTTHHQTRYDLRLSEQASKEIEVAGAGYYYGMTQDKIDGKYKYYGMFLIDIDGYLPYLTEGTWDSDILKGSEGYVKNSDGTFLYYNTVNDYNKFSGGIVNRRQAPLPAIEMSSVRMMSTRKVEPKLVAYATGIDKLNLELANLETNLNNVVILANNTSYRVPFNGRVITINYNFKDDFTIKYNYLGKEYIEDFKAKDLVKTVDTYKGEYYYLNSHKVGNSKLEFGSDMIHLDKNEVLNKSGAIYNIDTKEYLRSIDDNNLFKVTNLVSLYEDTYEGKVIKTFRNFSLSDDKVIDAPILVKDNKTYPLLTSDVSKLGFILKDDLVYYLESNGVLSQFGNQEIKLPKGISLKNIKEINDNYDSDLSILLIRYNNNSLVGFNYLTGEKLNLKNQNNEVSLKDFVKSNKSNSNSNKSLVASYSDSINLQEEVNNNKVVSSTIDNVIKENKESKVNTPLNLQVNDDVNLLDGKNETSGTNLDGKEEGSLVDPNLDVCTPKEPSSVTQEANKNKNDKKTKEDKYMTIYNQESGEFEVHDKYELLDSKVSLEDSISIEKIMNSLEKEEMLKPKFGGAFTAIKDEKKHLGLPITVLSIVLVLGVSSVLYFRRNK